MSNTPTPQNEHWKVLVLFLKAAAAEQGINNAQLAIKAGVSRSTVMRIFNLDFCPKLDIYLAIAKALDLNLFFESKNADTDLSKLFESAMTQLGRRPDKLNKN